MAVFLHLASVPWFTKRLSPKSLRVREKRKKINRYLTEAGAGVYMKEQTGSVGSAGRRRVHARATATGPCPVTDRTGGSPVTKLDFCPFGAGREGRKSAGTAGGPGF